MPWLMEGWPREVSCLSTENRFRELLRGWCRNRSSCMPERLRWRVNKGQLLVPIHQTLSQGWKHFVVVVCVVVACLLTEPGMEFVVLRLLLLLLLSVLLLVGVEFVVVEFVVRLLIMARMMRMRLRKRRLRCNSSRWMSDNRLDGALLVLLLQLMALL